MEKEVLHDVSIKFNDGEFTALIGPTGSGKSTLIQHLNLLLSPTSGEVLYNGERTDAEGFDRKGLRGRIGLMFQYPEYQLFETEILEDVKFGPKNQGYDEEETLKRARHAMNLVGLDESFDKRSPFDLSGGQKRKVAIAGVLAMRPEIIVLDEPVAGLDPGGKKELLEQISRLHRRWGMGVVLVSHSMENVAEYAERLVVLCEGRILFDDTPKNVFKHRAELQKIGLAAPQMTELAYKLNDRGFEIPTAVTTVGEIRAEILKKLGRNPGASASEK